MTPDKIIVTILGIAGVVFTAWFFFGKKDEVVEAKDKIDIKVSGGYSPSKVILKKGKQTILSFFRTDKNPCLEDVVFSDFKIKKYLPLNRRVDIAITPTQEGEYDISCGMNMFHGKIIVK